MASGSRDYGSRPRRSFSRSSSQSQGNPKDFTYDALVTSFMFEVTEKKPSLVQEFSKVFTPGATLEEMFKFLWNINEAKDTLTPKLTFSLKSTKTAHTYWKQGNSYMKNGDRDHALNFYNMSLREAPHPVMVIDGKEWGQHKPIIVHTTSATNSSTLEEDIYEEGWGDYTALARAYEARAKVLLSLEQYQKCSEDIDRVLALGCPQSVAESMTNMREECEKLGQLDVLQTTPSGKDHSVSFMYRSPEPPTLDDPNPSYPSFSDAVEFFHDNLHGRHMVAIRNIAPGEIVSVEKAHSAVLYPKYFREYCTICLKRAYTPVPCPNCSTIIFCSEKCRLDGLAGCHKVECPILYTLSKLNMSNNAVLLIRLLADIGYINLKSMVPPLQKESDTDTLNLGLDNAGVYSSSNYRTVFNLVTNREKRGINDLLKRTMETFVLLKLLVLSDEYYVGSLGEKVTVKDDEIIFTGAMLMHHMMILWCNADNIGEIQHDQKKSITSPVVSYGTGLFPSTSLLNHACYSTCASVSYGHVLVMRACRTIPAGTQITRQYADLYHKKLEHRVATLKARYHFVCRCLACVGNWPHSLPFNVDYDLRCIVCGEPVNRQRKNCDKCDISYNKEGPLTDKPNLITYDYSVMRTKVDIALDRYKSTLTRFMEGSDTADDLQAIKELNNLHEKYVVLPTHDHVAVQSLLHAVRLREGASAYVKGDGLSLDCSFLEGSLDSASMSG